MTAAGIPVTVFCHAGYRGDEEPRSFMFGRLEEGSKRIEVAEVIDRWYGPDYRCFKVRAPSGERYLLRHHEDSDSWELEFFDSTTAP